MTRIIRLVGGLLVPLLLLLACSSDDDSTSGADTSSTSSTASGTATEGDPVVIGAVMPETGDFGFVGTEAIVGIKAAVRRPQCKRRNPGPAGRARH